MSDLTKAIQLAAAAHQGQIDKAEQPYFLHPLRVMLALEREDDRIVAVLHDVVEDTEISAGDLRCKGFSESVIEAVLALTRGHGETYDSFIARCATNDIARRVKLADIDDNMRPDRVEAAKLDSSLLERYRKARSILEAAAAL